MPEVKPTRKAPRALERAAKSGRRRKLVAILSRKASLYSTRRLVEASGARGHRATVIDTNGNAIADSEIAVSTLENEGRLPEFATALRGSTGVEIRSRNGVQVLFVAVPVSGGAVRLAYPLADVEAAESGVTRRLFLACVVAIAVAGTLSAVISRIVFSS